MSDATPHRSEIGYTGKTFIGNSRLFHTFETDDRELVEAIESYAEGPARDEFILSALKIGVLALRRAQGQIDAEAVRKESERLLTALDSRLDEHQKSVQKDLLASLREYFDPHDGRFNERVNRLIAKDGELEQLIRRQIGTEDSELTRTLGAHLGEASPLMSMLSPDQSRGVLALMNQILEKELTGQRDRILSEFSLDNGNSALSRLVKELGQKHENLQSGINERIETVVGEFSLDSEDSALSRLVSRVEKAQSKISSEFSLDEDSSALARLKKEILGVLEGHSEATRRFETEVRETLASMQARKEEAKKSTRHGIEFEEAACELVMQICIATGDVAEPVGNTTGLIRNCKVGDCVVTLGPDSASAGEKIVLEFKESSSYTLAKALEEIDEARRNRGANVGIFVFSVESLPRELSVFQRYGRDLVVVWNQEDPISDIYLSAAISVAKALCIDGNDGNSEREVDFIELEKAIRDIEKHAGSLDEISGASESIIRSGEKIRDRVRIAQKGLQKHVVMLDEMLATLKSG
ncbi:hypothetical protein KDL29_03720 [bacterium]|nr:hypothetical protein [bacterium]